MSESKTIYRASQNYERVDSYSVVGSAFEKLGARATWGEAHADLVERVQGEFLQAGNEHVRLRNALSRVKAMQDPTL